MLFLNKRKFNTNNMPYHTAEIKNVYGSIITIQLCHCKMH